MSASAACFCWAAAWYSAADLAGPRLEVASLLFDLLLPGGQFLGPTAELLLERLAGFFLPGQDGFALLDRVPVGRQLLLQFQQLGRPALELGRQGFLFGHFGVEPFTPLRQIGFVGRQFVLQFANADVGRFKFAVPAFEDLPFGRMGEAVGLDPRTQLFQRLRLLLQVALGRLLAGPLLGEEGRLLPDLVPHPLQLGAQRGQHRLLALDLGGPLGQPGGGRLGFEPHLLEPFVLGPLGGEGVVDLAGLLFQFQRVAAELLPLLLDFGLGGGDLPLPLVDRILEAVEPDQVGPVALFLGGQRRLAVRTIGVPAVDVLAGRLQPRGDFRLVVVEPLPGLLEFGPGRGEFLFAASQVRPIGLRVPRTGGRAPVPARSTPAWRSWTLLAARLHRLMQAGEAIAPLLVEMVPIPLFRRQFVAELLNFLLPGGQRVGLGLQLGGPGGEFLFALSKIEPALLHPIALGLALGVPLGQKLFPLFTFGEPGVEGGGRVVEDVLPPPLLGFDRPVALLRGPFPFAALPLEVVAAAVPEDAVGLQFGGLFVQLATAARSRRRLASPSSGGLIGMKLTAGGAAAASVCTISESGPRLMVSPARRFAVCTGRPLSISGKAGASLRRRGPSAERAMTHRMGGRLPPARRRSQPGTVPTRNSSPPTS